MEKLDNIMINGHLGYFDIICFDQLHAESKGKPPGRKP